MAYIHALSDIHGNIEALEKALDEIFTEGLFEEDQIIFCGDYVDGGSHSYEVLNTIMELEEQYPKQIITLFGNHDEWFYEWLFKNERDFEYYPIEFGYYTIKSFFDEKTYSDITQSAVENISLINQNDSREIAKKLAGSFRQEILHADKYTKLMKWLKEKYHAPRYYETENQIFVHAGIDEEAGEWWKLVTPTDMFTNKYPATRGSFEKTIIAGHIYSDEIGGIDYLGKVFWDKRSHFYIDGHTSQTNIVPILKYDTEKSVYSSNGILIGRDDLG